MKITLQKTDVNDTEQRLFDARAEISRLYDTIYMLQMDIEKQERKRTSGRVLVNVKQLIEDLKFMEYSGEETVYMVFDDGRFVKLDSLEDLSRDMRDIW